MIAEGFTCQRYGFNVGADKFSLLTIENGKTSIMRLSEWTLISQSQKSHSDRLLGIFLGALGVHNFYAGYQGRGLAQLLITIFLGWTILFLLITSLWAIIEVCVVTKDADGINFQ